MTPELIERMIKLGLLEEDLEESFIRGTGPGGQKINKTSSTVVLKHLPTGTEVRCQLGRSRTQNRVAARQELCDRIEKERSAVAQAEQQEREKKRRQTRKRPRGVKEKILKSKHHRSDTKKTRGSVKRWD